MSSKKKFFENFNLYAVTNIEGNSAEALSAIEKAYRGGAGVIQLRSQTLTDLEMLRLGLKAKQIARHYGKGLSVNNRVDLALAIGADAVHIGHKDLPIEHIREILNAQNSSILIGKSTHSLEQAIQAQDEGADYIGVGPIFATPTKPDYTPVSIELIHQVRKKIHIPFVAIGGIHEQNVGEVLEAGASCVAVVRAVFSSPDPYQAASRLSKLIAEKQGPYVKS